MSDAPASLRARVAAQLDHLTAAGGPLSATGPRATVHLARYYRRGRATPPREAFRRAAIDRYLARQPSVAREGRAAVLTAGPPGAGKSTVLEQLGLLHAGWRHLDADIVKTFLIEQAVADGSYDDLLAHVLDDGHPILPAELAALTHAESVSLIEEIRADCLRRGENVLIEGTLIWPAAGADLLAQLVGSDYREVTIVDVEVPAAAAHERALKRWWAGRRRHIDTGAGLGGRFTPRPAIDRAYPDPTEPHSICLANTRAMFDSPAARDLPMLTLRIYDSTGPTPVIDTHQRREGVLHPQPQDVPGTTDVRQPAAQPARQPLSRPHGRMRAPSSTPPPPQRARPPQPPG